MASHPHHLCRPSTATGCCCGCYSSCCDPPQPDPLLHHHHPPPPTPYFYSNPPQNPHYHHHQTPNHPPPIHLQKQQHFHHQQQQQSHNEIDEQNHLIVSSLLRRIAALESSLRHQFPPKSTSRFALRDAAARTIQTHFRAFLVRRSRTLRQLKDLASIKSSLCALKSSFSDNAHLAQAISRKAMDLLLKLDSIQGGHSMIRDGKKSISRDLVRFLGFIDGVSVKKNKLSSAGLKNMKTRVFYNGQKIDAADFLSCVKDERDLNEKMRARVETIQRYSGVSKDDEDEPAIELENFRILNNGLIGSLQKRNGILAKRQGGGQSKVKKSVSFAENGNDSRVFMSSHEPNSWEDGSIDKDGEIVDILCGEVHKIGGVSKGNEEEEEEEEEPHSEDEESSQISSGEEIPRSNLRAEENYQGDNGNFVFSAPMPVKMESRADLMKKRKALKIVD